MDDFTQLQQLASNLRKSKRYAEALPYFEQLWTQHHELCDDWDVWGYAQTLRKLNRSSEALEVCRELYRKNSDFAPGRNLYGWCIYDTELKGEDLRDDGVIAAVRAIVQLTPQEQYSPYEWAVFKLLDYLKGKPNPDWNQILEWGDCLDPTLLSTEPNRYTDSSGKSRVNASPREKWYMHMTKALEELSRFEDCINLCQHGLQDIPTLHHDNDVWFRWRIAKSKIGLGQIEEAIGDLHFILERKQDWFFSHELANAYSQMGKHELALEHALTAALAPGEVSYKWKLYVLLADLLERAGKPEEAEQHLLLAAKIHQESGWDIPSEVANRVDVDVENETPGVKRLSRQLEELWKQLRYQNKQRYQGVIRSLLSNGKAGFIKDEAGNDHYFQAQSFEGPLHRMCEGTRVTFFVEDSFDKKKNKKSTKAVNVEPV